MKTLYDISFLFFILEQCNPQYPPLPKIMHEIYFHYYGNVYTQVHWYTIKCS